MKLINIIIFCCVFLANQGCKNESHTMSKVINEDDLVLPTIIDLMEYHNGKIVLEGSLNTKYSNGYDEITYGNMKIEFSPKGQVHRDNAYALIIKMDNKEIELILPNASHHDFRVLIPNNSPAADD